MDASDMSKLHMALRCIPKIKQSGVSGQTKIRAMFISDLAKDAFDEIIGCDSGNQEAKDLACQLKLSMSPSA